MYYRGVVYIGTLTMLLIILDGMGDYGFVLFNWFVYMQVPGLYIAGQCKRPIHSKLPEEGMLSYHAMSQIHVLGHVHSMSTRLFVRRWT